MPIRNTTHSHEDLASVAAEISSVVKNAKEFVAVANAIQHLHTVLTTVEALRLETGD